MFSRAAFTSAARFTSHPHGANPADLDLCGPGSGCPVEFGDEGHGGDAVPADPTTPLPSRAQDALPPAQGALPVERQEFRREVCATAKPAFATSAAPGTVRTYEATLRATAPEVTAKLGPQVLPMPPEDVLYAFSSTVVSLGPKAAS